MELQANYRAFEALNAEIMAIAQEEADPASLMRMEGFVKSTFPVVADPEKLTRDFVDRFGVYVVDRKGDIRAKISGTKAARPRLDLILQELAAIQGADPPAMQEIDGKIEVTEPAGQAQLATASDVLDVRWMWSHDRVRPGDEVKLAFCAVMAEGFHVYSPWETQMSPFSVALEIPSGLDLLTPIAYPAAKEAYDAAVDLTLELYEGDIPLSTLVFRARDGLSPGPLRLKATISYQACNNQACFPPTKKVVEMTLEAGSKEMKRQEVYGWKSW